MPADGPTLVSTHTGKQFPFDRMNEFAPEGESLEVVCPRAAGGTIRSGKHLWERFADFLPFSSPDPGVSLGEGFTPLLPAPRHLAAEAGLAHLLLKNETQNPTWSFKDRGSLTCLWMTQHMQESVTATISTGNMGHSIAAYATHAGVPALVFVPAFTSAEKLQAVAMHGATVIRIDEPDYAVLKRHVLSLAEDLSLRIVSGNGPVRVEGYKLTAFELLEQMDGEVPEWIAVPTSACGHVRGLFKGYRELYAAGIITTLPRMVMVQAAQCAPIVRGLKLGTEHPVPFTNVQTIAEAISSGDPPGGEELLRKAREFGWLAEEVTEEEIRTAQTTLASAGFLVEPAAAAGFPAVVRLVRAGHIRPHDRVVLMLTGSGLKDMVHGARSAAQVHTTLCSQLREVTARILDHHRVHAVQ